MCWAWLDVEAKIPYKQMESVNPQLSTASELYLKATQQRALPTITDLLRAGAQLPCVVHQQARRGTELFPGKQGELRLMRAVNFLERAHFFYFLSEKTYAGNMPVPQHHLAQHSAPDWVFMEQTKGRNDQKGFRNLDSPKQGIVFVLFAIYI